MRSIDELAENPFHVLGLTPSATRIEVERVGQKLIAQLEIGAASAKTYRSVLGTRERTADLVRRALAELRDPDKRAVHELWARAPLGEMENIAGWDGALRAIGARR